jgi:hypothetical protein
MKSILVLALAFSFSALAQNNSTTQPVTSQSTSSMAFTNSAGVSFTAEQLADEIRNLRNAVDRAMPVLAALNETYSNTVANQTLTGKLTGLVSGALNRNKNNAASANSGTWSTLMAKLQGALNNNNASSSATLTPATERDLLKLREQLQPVQTSLAGLSIAQTPDSSIATRNSGTRATNSVLTPTGR